MKINLLIVACYLLFTNPVEARRIGNETGHGGDATALEFVGQARNLLTSLEMSPIQGIDNQKLADAIFRTKVRSTDNILTDFSGNPVDAINHPELNPPEIAFRREAWTRLQSNSFALAQLILHEYLNVAGIDDRRYQLSSQLDRVQVCQKNAVIRESIERAFNGIPCYRITEKDLRERQTFSLVGPVETLKPQDLEGLSIHAFQLGPHYATIPSDVRNIFKFISLPLGANVLRHTDGSSVPVVIDFPQAISLTINLFSPETPAPLVNMQIPLVDLRSSPNLLFLNYNLNNWVYTFWNVSPNSFTLLPRLSDLGLCDRFYSPILIGNENSFRGLNVLSASVCLSLKKSTVTLDKMFEGATIPRLILSLDDISMLADDVFSKLNQRNKILNFDFVAHSGDLSATDFARFTGIRCEPKLPDAYLVKCSAGAEAR